MRARQDRKQPAARLLHQLVPHFGLGPTTPENFASGATQLGVQFVVFEDCPQDFTASVGRAGLAQ
jgi:hypothetical protein